ncbi:MAG: hypothetical protein KGN36_04680 [Acidobacteriota bacterium]|nr:hypothetical protein [Acidobacteriota bacterium]
MCSLDGRPYLSLVATARNGNRGDELLDRTQLFVSGWIEQARRHNLPSELILVEWNPPEDRPRLAEALHWPADTGPTQVRILEVPAEIHRRYRRAAELPLSEMAARNVGIRRARGEFILATNTGILFSSEMVRFLAARQLDKGKLYRTDRYDAAAGVPADAALDEQLAWCRSHITRICARHGSYRLTADGMRENPPGDIVPPGSGIWFGEGWFETERTVTGGFRWMASGAQLFLDVPPGGGALQFEAEAGPGAGAPPHALQVLDDDGEVAAEWLLLSRTTLRLDIPDTPGGRRRIRFRAPGGGLPTTGDPRITDFRFYRIEWMETGTPGFAPRPFAATVKQWMPILLRLVKDRLLAHPLSFPVAGPRAFLRAARLLRLLGGDILDGGAAFRLGGGWHSFENTAGITFRWAHGGSEVGLCLQDGTARLAMLVEPGPSAGFQPFDLVIRMEGRETARARIRGVTYVEFDVPVPQGQEAILHLNPENPRGPWGQPIANEARTLNYRVLACGRRLPPGRPLAPEPAPPDRRWPTRVLAIRRAETDWTAALAPEAKAIAEMGRPPFLHLNACGDFQMMAREDWYDVRGYAELDESSAHPDSILSYAACCAGKEEVFLPDPMRIYRIEGRNAFAGRSAGAANSGVAAMAAHMRRLHAAMIFNLDDWGMAGEPLRESTFQRAEAAQ